MIITMREAARILGDQITCKGVVFAKKHGLNALPTSGRHGSGKMVLFEQDEVVARAAEIQKSKRAQPPRSPGFTPLLGYRLVNARADMSVLACAIKGLYEELGIPLNPAVLSIVDGHRSSDEQ